MYNDISNKHIRFIVNKHHKYLTYTAYGLYAYIKRTPIFQAVNRYPHHLLLLYAPLYVVVVVMTTTGYILYLYIFNYLYMCILTYYMQSNILLLLFVSVEFVDLFFILGTKGHNYEWS